MAKQPAIHPHTIPLILNSELLHFLITKGKVNSMPIVNNKWFIKGLTSSDISLATTPHIPQSNPAVTAYPDAAGYFYIFHIIAQANSWMQVRKDMYMIGNAIYPV